MPARRYPKIPYRCIVEGCNRPSKNVSEQSACMTHYRRMLKFGGYSDELLAQQPNRGCSIDGCDKPHHGKGYCQAHWSLFKKYGKPEIKDTECQLFFEKCLSIDTEHCIEWPYSQVRNGYGRLNYNQKSYLAHRLALALRDGMDPDALATDMYCLHKCDNPSCINPNHLFWGNHAENMRDMWSKGRGHTHARKLKENDVQDARAMREKGYTHRAIAETFGVSRHTIMAIVKRRTWKHIK